MKDDTRRFYAVLGVPTGATAEQIRDKYRSMLIHARAAIRGGQVDFAALNEAREAYFALTTDTQARAA
ncbi:MAG: hypothetical protein AMJ64_05605 [Betaproteobacteria bacterium SG8_39]|nr:MAG: hypothetical protein AMJ64_05605 [Betaproteobacteria bacterium SG8_39]